MKSHVGWSEKLNCRGMLALRNIKNGETVEACPIIKIRYDNRKQRVYAHPTVGVINNYYYDWDDDHWCLPLGYAMIYNHSYHPNMTYVFDYENELLVYVAICDIHKNEELTVNYNGDPTDQTPIDSWFKEYFGKEII